MTKPENLSQIPLPSGFRWAAAAAAIKKKDRLDLAMAAAEPAAVAAATFTRNLFCAAPVSCCRDLIQRTPGKIGGIVVNSGCANAATGPIGLDNAQKMAETAAKTAASASAPFLVCSTGTIGVQLPMDRIETGIAAAGSALDSSPERFLDFANAILTTDTRNKIAWARFSVASREVTILGCAKGAGMICPDMATLLAFVFTDVHATPQQLQECFSAAADRSLNCLTVDGDTSTNDSAILLASGCSGADLARPEVRSMFQEKLLEVLQDLARQLARDGEGATKLVEVRVSGAADFQQARKIGLGIANSNLVKTAIYGRDANWGRIVCAIGNSEASVNPDHVSVRLGPLLLFDQGRPLEFSEEEALQVLSGETVRIDASVGSGSGCATVWTCDLTEKYIEINGSYRT